MLPLLCFFAPDVVVADAAAAVVATAFIVVFATLSVSELKCHLS